MKSFIVLVALVACALASPVREKRGFLSGLHSAGVYSGAYGDYSGYSAPIVSLSGPSLHHASLHHASLHHASLHHASLHHVVPQVVPHVVSVNRVLAAPSYSPYSSGLGYGYGSGWNSGYGSGSYHGLW